MLYKTLNNTYYKADKDIVLYISDGRYIIQLIKFGNTITFRNRFAFEMYLLSPNCFLYTKINEAA